MKINEIYDEGKKGKYWVIPVDHNNWALAWEHGIIHTFNTKGDAELAVQEYNMLDKIKNRN